MDLLTLVVLIDNFKKVPLSMASSVEIILQPQIILDVVDFGSFA